jgi:hypothetical protein
VKKEIVEGEEEGHKEDTQTASTVHCWLAEQNWKEQNRVATRI